ncbi:MAG: toxin-antitoxin system YwqK family antitoxin [Bacteroidales bacterium]|nr:toxin-antitoxin system YwqK family antitoxin [Bacteroidales bacterium]
MKRYLALSFFMLIIISSFGQARQGSDKLYYDENGKLFTGISYDYYPDSTVKAVIELKNGEPDGVTKIYFENGQLEETRSFKKGMMHGKWESWNRDNIRIAEANYVDNKKDGKWFVWDNNGVLRYDMTYKNGMKTGTWFMYDENGKLTDQKRY